MVRGGMNVRQKAYPNNMSAERVSNLSIPPSIPFSISLSTHRPWERPRRGPTWDRR